jgi:hypothetical protein
VVARDATSPDRPRDASAAWESVLAGSGLPLAGLDLPVPRPRFVIAAALPAGVPGEAELVDLWLTERTPRWRLREALDGRLPPGNRLVDAYDAWLGQPALPGQVVGAVYRAALNPGPTSLDGLRAAAAAMLAAASLPRRRPKGDVTVAYDLRPFLEALSVEPGPDPGGSVVRMTLRHDPEKGIGRPDEVLAELGERTGGRLSFSIVVREGLVLRERGPEPEARPTSPRRARR